MGVMFGAVLIGFGVSILVAPVGGQQTGGSNVAGASVTVLGLGFALSMLNLESHWVFDDRGIHRITGLGRRTTRWDEVARLRLVLLPLARKSGPGRARRLYFLDATGRALSYLPYLSTAPRGRVTAPAGDIQTLRHVADECHRRGWMTALDKHRRAGNVEGT